MAKKGDGRRVERVEKEVHGILSRFLAGTFTGDLPGIVTIHHVKMPADLRAARISISVLGGDARAGVLAAETLQQRASDMQAYLAKNLPMRYTPRLTFVADSNLDKVLKIDQMIKEISEKKNERSEEE